MARRRLLVVSDEMEVGGSQRQISLLLQGIDRTHWDAELVYFRNSSFLVDVLKDNGIRVHHIPKRGRVDLRFLWRLASLLRRGRYDVVHAFSLTAELWTLLARSLAFRPPPLVSSVRGLYSTEPAWFWRIKRQILRRSAATIANASAAADVAAKLSGLPRRSFDVIANGVASPAGLPARGDALRRDHVRSAVAAPRGRTMGLFVGRLVAEKNLDCLLRALARMPRPGRPWIAIAGEGLLRGQIGATIAAMHLEEDVRLLGERSDTGDLMAGADFFVLPSSREGMPNALMEAMAAGCPAVASRVGGIPELLEHDVTGLLFANDDDAALADCLQRICSDAALRERLAGAALRAVDERFSVRAMIRGTTAVYERCIAGPAMAGRRDRDPRARHPETMLERKN